MTKYSWGDVETCGTENRWIDLFFQSCSHLIRLTWQIPPSNKNRNKTYPRWIVCCHDFWLKFCLSTVAHDIRSKHIKLSHIWSLANNFFVFALIYFLVLSRSSAPDRQLPIGNKIMEILKSISARGRKSQAWKKGLENLFQYIQYIEV